MAMYSGGFLPWWAEKRGQYGQPAQASIDQILASQGPRAAWQRLSNKPWDQVFGMGGGAAGSTVAKFRPNASGFRTPAAALPGAGVVAAPPAPLTEPVGLQYTPEQRRLMAVLSSRRAKRQVRTVRDMLPGGKPGPPPPAVGALANALGELHGAVRALGKDVAQLKGRR